jgi:glutamate-1-semialdehyde 2,1-aminomutase
MTTPSPDLYERARRVLPGGVTAAARANAALGRPLYIERAAGSRVYDSDGRALIDMCMSNGGTLLGHGHPGVVAALTEAAQRGLACGYDGEAQIALAERLVAQIPAFEMVRFTTTGTEATLYAVRIARAYTGRAKVMKFEGHFHGFNDPLAFSFWPSAAEGGPADAPRPRPESLGLPPASVDEVIVAPFNETDAFVRLLDQHGDQLAAVIMEPINYDSGAIMPEPDFLNAVRAETARRGIVLIFDEILSGYRTGPDGAQGYLGVTPDLATLGKAIGGGAPLSVFGGQRALMSVVAPLGRAVHTGTYNAHLLQMLAAQAFLDVIDEPGFFATLIAQHQRLYDGLTAAFASAQVPVRVQGIGARFALYFGLDPATPVTRYRQAASWDRTTMQAFCRAMDARGVYVNPAWHHGISAMHTTADVDAIVEAAHQSARTLAPMVEAGAISR